MALGILLFFVVFLGGLALGAVTHRPMVTALLVVGAFVALVVSKSGNGFAAFAAFALIALAGAIASSVRETVELLLGGSPRVARRRGGPRSGAASRQPRRRARPRPPFSPGMLEPSSLLVGSDWLPSANISTRDPAGRPSEGQVAA
jgi:hypothetical protein